MFLAHPWKTKKAVRLEHNKEENVIDEAGGGAEGGYQILKHSD